MPKYLVETVSSFRHRYAVEAEDANTAINEVKNNIGDDMYIEWSELSQRHIGEIVFGCREVTDDDIIEAFDEDYSKDIPYTREYKLKHVNKVK